MTRFCILFGTFAFAASQGAVFFYAPQEATLGLSQKIFYLHLPLAWWALVSFFIVFLCSIFFLKKQNPIFSHLAYSCAEIGELCALLTVLTGIIWGYNAWGVWWTWDPRLTTALILCLIYAGWLILAHLDIESSRKAKLLAVIGILAFLDVPLVFFSARIWRSIHPAVFTSQGAAMTPEMLLTTLLTLFSFGFFWLGLVSVRYQIQKLDQRCTDLFLTALTKENEE
ncbi:MAG: cytochrome c biogenesis protein CcsA [Desulfovibrio sp.]|nr:cytochrome c biogenesis protein CcsA [Desulfovibrio sp.]